MNYKKILILTVVLLVIIPPVIFAFSILFPNEPVAKKIFPIIEKVERKIDSPIGKLAKNNLFSKQGEYGIYIKNLKTDEEYVYQGNKSFDSASLYKLWVMAAAYEKINEGKLTKDQVLSSPLKKLDDTLSTISPTPVNGDAPQPTPEEEKFISMRTDEAIEKMITVSDNYAALLVASGSGNLSIVKFIKDNGFVNSNFKQPPQTSAVDIGKFYELLYHHKLVNKEYSDEMISILKRQAINDRIPKYLPEESQIAHKTGELFGAKHDAGIVYSNSGDYIIVVLTETKDSDDAAERIANFSKDLYDYFNKN